MWFRRKGTLFLNHPRYQSARRIQAVRHTHPANHSSSELQLCFQPLQQQFQVGKNASAPPRVKIIMKNLKTTTKKQCSCEWCLSWPESYVPCCCPFTKPWPSVPPQGPESKPLRTDVRTKPWPLCSRELTTQCLCWCVICIENVTI